MAEESNHAVRDELQATIALFGGLRAAWTGPGLERGGHLRPELTPVYVKMYGPAAELLFQDLTSYTVEGSFSPEQQPYVSATLQRLKEVIDDKELPLAERIVKRFLDTTRPYFLAALLRAIEDALEAMIERHPGHSVVLDAIFRVAGSEGIRDLIRVYGAHLLEAAIEGGETSLPGITAFVNAHDRQSYAAGVGFSNSRYEVWCPGTDLAKVVFRHSQIAAAQLVAEHSVRAALPLHEELTRLPPEISTYLTAFVQARITPVLKAHGLPATI